MSDTLNLSRFLTAQEPTYQKALAEIKSGRKQSHWMWYIFPQMAGLGFSDTAKFYGIKSREEAIEYLDHPILGSRLREISHELLKIPHSDAYSVFGSPDDMKLKSCATLFSLIERSDENVFKKILDKFFGGQLDQKTEELVARS
jgi:uncharacterized protein (DUF1810 family)